MTSELCSPWMTMLFTHMCCVFLSLLLCCLFFFFNDTATTEIYTLSLHDALPISVLREVETQASRDLAHRLELRVAADSRRRSEEHTSELQSPVHLVCRLLLEKKKKNK